MPKVYLTRLPFADKDLAKSLGARWDGTDRMLWWVDNPIAHKACIQWCENDISPFEVKDWRYFRYEDNARALAERCRYCPVAKAWYKPSLEERREYAQRMQAESTAAT
jgi:hypothetical protein